MNLSAVTAGQRPETKPAKGNALGGHPAQAQALKGRDNSVPQ